MPYGIWLYARTDEISRKVRAVSHDSTRCIKMVNENLLCSVNTVVSWAYCRMKQYTHTVEEAPSLNVLKSISFRYVQNMIENMILTSYSEKSYLAASWGGYVASIQIMSRDKLKHSKSSIFVVRQIYLSRNMTFLSRGGYIVPWV